MNNHSAPAHAGLSASVVEQLRRVSTATLTMVLLKRGVRTSWLGGVAPLTAMGERVVGPAFTIRFVPGREDLSQPESYAASPSFRDAIEAAPAGSVVVIDGRGNRLGATLGDILVARLAKRGVLAAVTDAPVRDGDEIAKLPLAVLCAGMATLALLMSLRWPGLLPVACLLVGGFFLLDLGFYRFLFKEGSFIFFLFASCVHVLMSFALFAGAVTGGLEVFWKTVPFKKSKNKS